MTVQELYEQSIKPLPLSERLRLAAIILNGVQPESVVEYHDDWSEDDLREATRYAFERAAQSFDEDAGDA